MNVTTNTVRLWVTLALAIVPAPALAQVAPQEAAPLAADSWQIGTSSSFLSGRYGTDTRTTVFYTPTTARRLFADGDLTLVFPFTCIKGDGGVTVVGGSPVRTERVTPNQAPTRPASPDRPGRLGEPSTPEEPAPALTVPVTTCGMGDVVVRGRYYLVDERGWIPTIALRAHVKAPTADAARRLGTGKADEGVGVEISRMFGGVTAMADAGYTLIGKPAAASYQNNWWYDIGAATDLVNGVANVSVFFEEYRSILPGLPTARDVLVSLMLKGGTGWRLQVSGQFGLSDGAPDRGLTFGASRRF